MSSSISVSSRVNDLHAQAIEICGRYQRAEAELIGILQQVDEHRVFIHRGHSSLFQYVVKELGLSEGAAYGLISVARKAREVPELKSEIERGTMTLSNARRIVPVLTRENKKEWIAKASQLSHRQLEKEIVRVRPQAATPERASYVTPTRVKLELGMSEREMLKLRRVQDLLSQARRRPVSLEETIESLTTEFLHRHDPVEKAKRHQVRKGALEVRKGAPVNLTAVAGVASPGRRDLSQSPARQSTPVGKLVALKKRKSSESGKPAVREVLLAPLLHQINLRDERKCAHLLPDGTRCNQARWIEIHHKVPVRDGGPNSLENLITLCTAHHQLQHF